MTKQWLTGLTIFCIVGSGTDGGAYFAFSTFVMRALQRLPVETKVAAFQYISIYAQNVWFAIALFGTGLASIALGIYALRNHGNGFLAWAALLYLVSLAITFGCNVPLNNRLASVIPGSSNAAEAWSRLWGPWMAWNHARTVLALASSGLFGAALMNLTQGEAR
jgi:uncharacterized membrane protein